MKTLINKDKVSHIYIYKASKRMFNYKWREGWWSKLFWLIPLEYHKPGYYSDRSFLDPYYEVPTNMFDKDGYLWNKPHVEVYCGEAFVKTLYKNTEEELVEICKDKFDNVNVQIK